MIPLIPYISGPYPINRPADELIINNDELAINYNELVRRYTEQEKELRFYKFLNRLVKISCMSFIVFFEFCFIYLMIYSQNKVSKYQSYYPEKCTISSAGIYTLPDKTNTYAIFAEYVYFGVKAYHSPAESKDYDHLLNLTIYDYNVGSKHECYVTYTMSYISFIDVPAEMFKYTTITVICVCCIVILIIPLMLMCREPTVPYDPPF
jgi:hypothetical protein